MRTRLNGEVQKFNPSTSSDSGAEMPNAESCFVTDLPRLLENVVHDGFPRMPST